MTNYAYAIVQHSAMTEKSDTTFAQGLESRSVTPAEGRKVTASGGLVFDDYGDAEDYCDAEQYPDGYNGLVPVAPGVFKKLGYHSIYIPVKVTA